MTSRITITTHMPAVRTEQVPDALRDDCLPGFTHRYWPGAFGHLLVQSVATTGIELYQLTGKIMTETRGRVFLPSPGFAVWIQLEGEIRLGDTPPALSAIGRGSLCLMSRTDGIPLQAKKGNIRGLLLLYPSGLILSLLSFYPQLSELSASLRNDKRVFSVHPRTGTRLLEKLHLLTHVPFIPPMEEFYGQTLTDTVREVFSGLSAGCGDNPVRLPDIASIHKAKEYIDGHLPAHFTIRQIARQAGINQLKLKTGFRDVYGTGLFEYLRRQRLTAARTALTETRLPLKEISRRAGYKSLSNFCTAYRRQFGITPGQARKQKGNR